MLTKRIIPCLDVKDGRVVKGVSFVNLRDAGDPVEVAGIYDREGADELCFLDITASHENRKTIIDVVMQTAARVFMPLTVGGGVRTLEDIRSLLNAGADKVSINTTAVQQPEFVREAAQRFGTQCIVVAIDAKRSEQAGRWEVYTHGGRKSTGLDAVEWAQRMEAVWRRGDPFNQHGSGWSPEWVRSSLDRGSVWASDDSRDCFRRSGNAGAFVRWVGDRQGGRRVGRFDFSFSDPYHSAGEDLFVRTSACRFGWGRSKWNRTRCQRTVEA